MEDHMGFVYKRAGMEDIELLVKTRIEVLRAANCLSDDTEMLLVEQPQRFCSIGTCKSG